MNTTFEPSGVGGYLVHIEGQYVGRVARVGSKWSAAAGYDRMEPPTWPTRAAATAWIAAESAETA